MARTRTNFRTRAAAMAALAGLTAFSLAGTPAFAGDWHGRGHGYGYGNGRGYGQPWGWSGERWDRGERRHDYSRHRGRDHDNGAELALIGGLGLLLGATLLAQPPAYYTPPPQVVYAPPPSAYYDQAPIQAVPASEVYRTSSGQYCREYQSTIRVGGQIQHGYGTACLGEDGDWRVVN